MVCLFPENQGTACPFLQLIAYHFLFPVTSARELPEPIGPAGVFSLPSAVSVQHSSFGNSLAKTTSTAHISVAWTLVCPRTQTCLIPAVSLN